MPSERLTFRGHNGTQLAARLDLPDGQHQATSILAHCFTCTKDIAAARRISQRLAALGIAVLRFDFTGLGHSQGEFANTTFSSNVADIVAAATHLTRRGMPPSLLIGHSLGGAAVLRATGQIEGIKAVATLNAPFDPAHVLRALEADIHVIETEGCAQVQLGHGKFPITQNFLDDVAHSKLTNAIGHLNAALLVLHAPRDEIVGIDNATGIFVAAKHPKSFVTLDDADHLISRAEDADYAAQVIATWASRYLGLRHPAPPPGAPEGVVRVSEVDPNGFLQDIQSGPYHHAIADEPLAYGGTNRGMTPYGFLASGLGACTAMTVRLYARRKGWPLKHIRVDVTQGKVHAQDASSSDKIDHFTRVIHLDGDLTDEQREKLRQIADKCPVHGTLTRGSKVTTLLDSETL